MSLFNLAGEITKAFEYIECNLSNKILLEDISTVSCISKYHIHRILSEIVNRPLMDYVRARKLTESLLKLSGGDYRIIDIAMSFAFDYEQSFSRAFKKEFGISPGVFKTNPSDVKRTKKILPLHYTSVADGILIHPIIEKSQKFNISRINMSVIENTNRWDFIDAPVFICDYDEHNQVITTINSDEDNQVVTTSNSKEYLVFKYIGLLNINKLMISHIIDLWDYIQYIFLPQSLIKVIDSGRFISVDISTPKDNYCELELCLPLLGCV